MGVWADLGISSGTGILILIVMYFVIKWAVRNGIEEAYSNITGKKTASEAEVEEMIKPYDYGTANDSSEELVEVI